MTKAMKKLGFLFWILALPIVLLAQEPAPKPQAEKKPKKVWTNEELGRLKGPINTVGMTPAAGKPEENKEGASPAAGDADTPHLQQLKQERAALRAELARTRAEREEAAEAAGSRASAAQLSMAQSKVEDLDGVIADSQARLQEVEAQIAALEKQVKARRPRPSAERPAASPPS